MLQGKCACGKVTYKTNDDIKEVSICHCKICQAVSGGIYFYFEAKNLEITNKDNLTVWKSSEHAERVFCSTCGSTVYCYIPALKAYHVSPGTLDDWKDLKLTSQIFIDRKPVCYNIAEETDKKTAEEMYKLWGVM